MIWYRPENEPGRRWEVKRGDRSAFVADEATAQRLEREGLPPMTRGPGRVIRQG